MIIKYLIEQIISQNKCQTALAAATGLWSSGPHLYYLLLRGMPAVEIGLNLTLDHMENPLKNNNFEKRVFLHLRDDLKAQRQIFISLGPQMADIRVNN